MNKIEGLTKDELRLVNRALEYLEEHDREQYEIAARAVDNGEANFFAQRRNAISLLRPKVFYSIDYAPAARSFSC